MPVIVHKAGEKLNINAAYVSAEVAKALSAEQN
jgi:acetylglutamate kinase